MNAQYDGIAAQYVQTKQSPLRVHVEGPTLMGLVGNISGLRVLDLACGDGHYTRALKAAGATEVVGVDISADMLDLAQQAEQRESLGLQYVCADVASLPDLGEFDCVVAAYLLHYAPDQEALDSMCRAVASALRPGARFVAINENPDYPSEPGGAYVQYGFSKTADSPLRDGSIIRYRMFAGRESFSFQAHYFSRETYTASLQAAGMEDIQWHDLQLGPEAANVGKDYFSSYLSSPPIIGLSCQRSA
ncbi:MAG: class I SAM-dependent methyltransferase [Gammaproteobacteria bacterium]